MLAKIKNNPRHCEERSDAAIQPNRLLHVRGWAGLPRRLRLLAMTAVINLAPVALALLFIIAAQPAFAQSNKWNSYTQDGFQTPVVMYNPINRAECPGYNCKYIRYANAEIVCPNVLFYDPETGDPLPYDYGLVRRLIPCVKETLLMAANNYVGPVVNLIGSVVAAASILAIVLLGALMIGGRSTAVWKDSMILALKLGGVSYFMSHLCYTDANRGGFAVFPLALDVIDDLASKVSSYVLEGSFFSYTRDCLAWTPPHDVGTVMEIWNFLDCTAEMLLGGILNFHPGGTTIQLGIIAFLLGCLVSKGLGITIGMMGLYLIVQLFWAVIRALYMYITAYLGVALCIIVAPFFIPTILFKVTTGYFFRWVQSLGGFMLQPVIILAYLAMLVSVFDQVIFTGRYSLTRVIAGSAVDCVDTNFQNYNNHKGNDFMQNGGLGGWMYGAGMWGGQYPCNYGAGYSRGSIGQTAVTMNPKGMPGLESAPDYGAPGSVVTTEKIVTTGTDFFGATGISAGNPNLLGIDMPVTPVDWDFLRFKAFCDGREEPPCYNKLCKECSPNPGSGDRRYDPKYYYPDPEANRIATNNYLLDVLKAVVMAFLVGYVFLKMLDVIPFIGAGVSMSGGMDLGAKTLGQGALAPPGSSAIDKLKTSGEGAG